MKTLIMILLCHLSLCFSDYAQNLAGSPDTGLKPDSLSLVLPHLKKHCMLTYMSYGLDAAGLITTFGGIYSLEGNVGNSGLEARNKNIIVAGFSLGIFTGLVGGDYFIDERFQILAGKYIRQ